MRRRFPRAILLAGSLILASPLTSSASLIYLYDFPGSSGLASDQSNPQPGNATFSDFTRTNLNPDPAPQPNEFDTIGWAHNGQDTTQYEGFSITAAAGYHLNLTSATFNAFQYASGATQGQAALFLNGSTTAYATVDFHWDVNGQVAFNFTPLTDANNVTLAEFRVYGWTAGSPNGSSGISQFAINGAIVLPEGNTWLFGLFAVALALLHHRRLKSHRA